MCIGVLWYIKAKKEVSDKMQSSVQPPHNELLYQGYVTEELEKAKKQAASTDTQWQSHDSVWESLNKKYGV